MIDASYCYYCSVGEISNQRWWDEYLSFDIEDRKKCLGCQIRRVE
jgi:hypothetical protein